METEKEAHLPLVGRSARTSRAGWGATGDDEVIVRLARGWIGTPYLHQASVKGVGCDCLGLLRGVWREMGRGEPEELPNYAPDWDDTAKAETLYMGLRRHLREAPVVEPGVIALFRMVPRGPAKHCGIVAEEEGALTLIHARQNKRVSEEPLSAFWRKKLVYAFRL
jgi:NlpC/P60 family putative phage cell wall peptidase